MDSVVLGGGCFWCLEAVFLRVRGVRAVISGYANGLTKAPSYEEVCTGRSGHAEVVEVRFDPLQLSLSDILAVFFAMHDPTTLNRQGNDVGTQYRSGIYVLSEAQTEVARTYMADLVKANPLLEGRLTPNFARSTTTARQSRCTTSITTGSHRRAIALTSSPRRLKSS